MWHDQSENMKQKIIEAEDDEELKKELGKILKRCNSHWGRKVKEAEQEAASQSTTHPVMSEVLEKRLDDSAARIKLMLEASQHLRDQEDARIVEIEDEADDSNELALLNADCKEWEELLERIRRLQKEYGEEVIEAVWSVEENLEDIWKNAVRLMKS
jgi:hypothetical protein